MCAVCDFYFQVSYFYFICLHLLIAPQSYTNEVFSIMSRPKTSYPGVAFSVVWYMLRTEKAEAANIPDQGSYLSI